MKKYLHIFLIFLIIGAKAQTTQGYDNLIVPGDRIGPVALGGIVAEVIKKLGKPDKVVTHWQDGSFGRHEGYYYDDIYKKNIRLQFRWVDEGLRPVVYDLAGVTAFDKSWVTAKGVHVGSSVEEVVAAYGEPDLFFIYPTHKESVMVYTGMGIDFFVNDRNSPVTAIRVFPPGYKFSY